jgi:hypothetical protein
MSDRVVITNPYNGIVHMQVCAVNDATEEEILATCNRENPSGTSSGWCRVCRDDDEFWGNVGPVACEDDPGRTHYMIAC